MRGIGTEPQRTSVAQHRIGEAWNSLGKALRSTPRLEKGVATAFFYGSEFHIVNCRFPKISTGIPFHRFGKTVFLSEKEAEQALKERERK